jgi:hypothetical protein
MESSHRQTTTYDTTRGNVGGKWAFMPTQASSSPKSHPGVRSANVLSFQAEADFNGDGTIDTRQSAVNTYNSHGQLVLTTSEADFNGDGTIDYTSVVTVVYNDVKH